MVELDDLGRRPECVVALPAVYVENALNVSLHAGAGIERARLELHFRSAYRS